jgi:hypothetical protein
MEVAMKALSLSLWASLLSTALALPVAASEAGKTTLRLSFEISPRAVISEVTPSYSGNDATIYVFLLAPGDVISLGDLSRAAAQGLSISANRPVQVLGYTFVAPPIGVGTPARPSPGVLRSASGQDWIPLGYWTLRLGRSDGPTTLEAGSKGEPDRFLTLYVGGQVQELGGPWLERQSDPSLRATRGTWRPQSSRKVEAQEAAISFEVEGTNPFLSTDGVTLSLMSKITGPARVEIFSVAGRKVRTLLDQPIPPGTSVLTWHGTDDDGRPVESGVYYARASVGEHQKHVRLVLLR